jgi:demethylmenaquinone methyltransferase/2-methoxy-6-polyprenyl-1,4-benzoquinol methylase
MKELARVVKPGGRIASLEFAVPATEPWHWLWRLYVQFGLPLLGGTVSREWAQTGRFLARSIPDFYARFPLAAVMQLWRRAGIVDVEAQPMSLGGGVVMWGTRGPTAGVPATDDAECGEEPAHGTDGTRGAMAAQG